MALWGLLVDQHLKCGKEFVFVSSSNGAALSYSGWASIPCPYEDADFLKLAQERLLELFRSADGQLVGVPTSFGIAAIISARLAKAAENPWKSNPFPQGSQLHGKWADVMLWAKEHLALLQADMLEKMPPEEAPSKAFAEHNLDFLAGVFDAWAGALSRPTPLTDDAADAYEHLLIELEKSLLAKTLASRPSFFSPRLYESEVKSRLNQRKQHWIGKILRAVREHKETTKVGAEIRREVPMPEYQATAQTNSEIAESSEGMSDAWVLPGSIPSRQSLGNPIVHQELYFPLLQHVMIASARGPRMPHLATICGEIVRLANRIQATENPELPPAEAGDRWLERLSPEPRAIWEVEEVLITSAAFCEDFATHLLRSDKRELALEFDKFAARFKALRAEHFPSSLPFPDVHDATRGRGEETAGTKQPVDASIRPDGVRDIPQSGVEEPGLRRLDARRIAKWMDDEGYTNDELATRLKISVRAVSSMRNNGNYHGADAVTKLANLMNCEVSDLYSA
jgi:hypothetical protein